jgi:hypothetical protein
MKKQLKHFSAAVAAIVLFTTSSCEEVFSDAKGTVSNFEVTPDFTILSDNPDAGVTVSFNVTNVGEKGVIKITPKLSCSEGEWTRQQTVTFDAGESQDFQFFFHEPTINASNIQGTLRIYPH